MGTLDQRVVGLRRFAVELGHSVRLPLSSLRTGTELLAELAAEDDGYGGKSGLIRMIQRGSDRLSDVADNLLALVDLIDATTGRRQMRTTPITLSELVTRAEFRLARRAPQAASRIVNAVGDDLWECETELMARAVYLTMDVALSRSSVGRDVYVRSESREFGSSVAILDGGPTLDRRRLKAASDISFPDEEGSEGHALALTVARMSAEAHGGGMCIENTSSGVRWTLNLPTLRHKAD